MSADSGKTVEEPVEVLPWADGSYSLPVRYIAELLDLSPQQMHDGGTITFIDSVSRQPVSIDIGRQKITCADKISPNAEHPLKEVVDGMISPNDIYMDQATLEKLLGIHLTIDQAGQNISLNTTRVLRAFLKQSDSAGQSASGTTVNPTAMNLPEKPVNSIDMMMLDADSSHYRQQQVVPTFSEGNSGTTRLFQTGSTVTTGVRGHLMGLPFELKPQWRFSNGKFQLSGMDWSLRKDWKNLHMDAGSLNVGLSPLAAPDLPIWGMQVSTANAEKSTLQSLARKDFAGNVVTAEPVALAVNGIIREIQPAAGRKYEFEEVELDTRQAHQIRVIQGNRILEETFIPPENNAMLSKGEHAISGFAGHMEPNFQLYGDEWLMPQSNKWVAGGRAFYGLSEKATIGLSAVMDHIFGSPQTSPLSWALSRNYSPDLTGYSSFRRDPNLVQGSTLAGSFAYRWNERWSLSANTAVSLLQERANDTSAHPDWAGEASGEYHGLESYARLKLFRYGTDFYTPTANINSTLFDRAGASFEGQAKIAGFHLQGTVEQYRTNLNNTIEGGPIDVTHWNGSLMGQLGRWGTFRLSAFRMLGHNEERKLDSANYQASLTFPVYRQFNGELTYMRSNVRNVFNPANPGEVLQIRDQETLTNTLQASIMGPMPNQSGTVQLGVSAFQSLNLANLMLSWHWKSLYLEPSIQASLFSKEQLATLGLGIYYQQPNGERVGFRYTYSHSSLPALTALGGNSGTSNQSAHQLQFDLSGTWALLQQGLAAVNRDDRNEGIVEGRVFLDLNQNGKREKNEPGIPGIDLLIGQLQTLKSGRQGAFSKTGVQPGAYQVNFDLDQLPIHLSPTTSTVNIVVEGSKKTLVSLGAISTPGSLKGTVLKQNPGGKELPPADIMVSLLDAQKQPVQVTYTDETGRYHLSNVPPGKYELVIDRRQADRNHYEILTRSYSVEVPMSIHESYTREHLDFKVLQLFESNG